VPQHTFETGASGSNVIAGVGSANDIPLDTVITGATCTVTYDSTHAAHGGNGCKILCGATPGEAYVSWTSPGQLPGAFTTCFDRTYLYFDANPGSTVGVLRWQSGGTLCAVVKVDTAGKVLLQDNTGTTQATSATTIPLAAWWRLEVQFVGSATTGQLVGRIHLTMDSLTADETFQTAATINTNGSADRARFGQSGSGVGNVTYWQDDIGHALDGFPGPIIGAANPSAWLPQLVRPGGNQVGPSGPGRLAPQPWWDPNPAVPAAAAVAEPVLIVNQAVQRAASW
jgi:hypothetical protein